MGYKGDFSAGSTQDFKYGHPTARKKIRDIGTQLQARATERIGIGEYLHGIGTDQRNWANLKIRPIERALSQVIRDRLTDTGQQALTASAQQGTMDAYDRSAASATRNAARYGVAIDPSQDRGYQLNRTASAIEAGDLAARTDRENALNEAGQMYGYGSSLPSDAAETYAAGAGSLADQGDYAAGIKIGKRVGEGDAATGAGMAWSGMADGGEVGNSRMGVMGTSGRVIDGEAVELDSGDFIVPEHAVQYYGQEFWDRIIAEAGGDVEPDYAYGGEVRYARGGVVDDDELEPIKWLREKLTGRRERIEGSQNADESRQLKELNEDGSATAPDERRYAEGGGVGLGAGMERGYAFSPGPIAENIITGLRSGLLGAERTRDADQAYQDRQEDRGYLRTDRAYQDKQRANAEKKLQYEKDLDFATANFVRSDGTNLGPIMDVYKKYSGDTAGDASVVPNQDGTFTFTESGGSAQKMTKEQLRSVGMNMIESMRDPKALIKSWNEKPQIHSTAEGAVSDAWNPRTRQWERVTTNPKDPKKDAAGKYNPLSNAKEIARLIGERLGGKYDDITGKMIKPPDDPELATALIAAAHEYERQNPGKLLPGEVVKNVFDQVVEAPREEDVRKNVRKEISEKTGYFSTDEADLGMPRKEYEKMRVKELAGSGFGIGKPAAPAAKPGQRTADDVKAEYKAGRLTREQAKKELKSMGFQ